MAKGIIIHIGQSKTGTTAIQRFFWLNREKFAERRVHYLQTGVTTPASPAHYGLLSKHFWQPEPQPSSNLGHKHDDSNKIWAVAVSEIENSPSRLFILSCESAWLLDDDAVRYIRSALARYPVFVALVLREPRAYIVSSYKQALKVGRFLGSFEEFLTMRRHLLNYPKLVNRWSTVFGRDNLGVFSYEEMREDLVGRFCSTLGLGGADLLGPAVRNTPDLRANLTPSDSALAAIRLVHRGTEVVPRSLQSLYKRFGRRLIRDCEGRLGAILAHLPAKLLTERDIQDLAALPRNDPMLFDSPDGFAGRITEAVR